MDCRHDTCDVQSFCIFCDTCAPYIHPPRHTQLLRSSGNIALVVVLEDLQIKASPNSGQARTEDLST
jgi:hypothetical protein